MTIVWLDARARATIEREAVKRRLLETGGALFGWQTPEETVVACASGPGPHARHRRRRFEPHRETTASVMAAVRQASDGRYGYIGSWHTHPRSAPIPSAVDLHTARKLATQDDLRLAQPVLLILSTTGCSRQVERGELAAWCWMSASAGLVCQELLDCHLDDYYAPSGTELLDGT